MDSISFFNNFSSSFVSFSWLMLLQSSILILILLALDILMRRKVKAVFRYCLWLLLLAKLLLPVGFALPSSPAYWTTNLFPETKTIHPPQTQTPLPIPTPTITTTPELISIEPVIEPTAIATPARQVTPIKTPTDTPPIPPVPQTQQPHISISWQSFATLTWLIAVLIMIGLLIQRVFFVNSLIRQSTPAADHLFTQLNHSKSKMIMQRKVDLRISPNATSPSVCGLVHPVILIPDNLTDHLNEKQINAILLHELAHIKRHDLWVNLIQALLQIAYFYNPLLWIANATIRRIREQAVDEIVLVTMADHAADYPETLLNVSKLVWNKPMLILRLIGVVESKSALTTRIKHILSRPFPKSAKLGIAGLTTILIAAAILLPMAKADTSNTEIIAKDYRLTRPVTQTELQAMANLASRNPRTPISNLFEDITGTKRVDTHNMSGYASLGKLTLIANKKQHSKFAKAFKKKYGKLVRPDNLYSLDDVADIDTFASNFSRIVKDVLTWLDFSFLSADDVEFIADDFAAFIESSARQDVSKNVLIKILESLDEYLYTFFPSENVYQREKVYLELSNKLKTLKLKLYQVIAIQPPTPEEQALLLEQKQWVYDQLNSFVNESPVEQASKKNRVDKVFDDILNGFSTQPMPEEAFKKYQGDIKKAKGLASVANQASTWSTEVAMYLYKTQNRDKLIFPFGNVKGISGGSDRVSFSFRNDYSRFAYDLWLGDITGSKGGQVSYDIATRQGLVAPQDCTTHEELEQWLIQQSKGDFYFNRNTQSVIACRGAKMAPLDVNNWIDANRISTEKLREIINANPVSKFSMSGFKNLRDNTLVRGEKELPTIPIIAVESASGEITLIQPPHVDRDPIETLRLIIRHRYKGWDKLWISAQITGQIDVKPVEQVEGDSESKAYRAQGIVSSVIDELDNVTDYSATVSSGIDIAIIRDMLAGRLQWKRSSGNWKCKVVEGMPYSAIHITDGVSWKHRDNKGRVEYYSNDTYGPYIRSAYGTDMFNMENILSSETWAKDPGAVTIDGVSCYRVYTTKENSNYEVWIDEATRTKVIRVTATDAIDQLQWQMDYGDYSNVENTAQLPGKIVAKRYREDMTIGFACTYRFSNVDINSGLPDSIFAVDRVLPKDKPDKKTPSLTKETPNQDYKMLPGYLPYFENVVTPVCNVLKAESVDESVKMLHQIAEYDLFARDSGQMLALPFPAENGTSDVHMVMSNRRFLKVLEELAAMPKSQAASIVNREINETLSQYLSIRDELVDGFRETGDLRPDTQYSNNPDKSPSFQGLRYKLLALVFAAGNLGLDETQPAIQKVAKTAIKQRKHWYYSREFSRLERAQIFAGLGIYNRQILTIGLFGSSGKHKQEFQDILKEVGVGLQKYKLTYFDAYATPYDYLAKGGAMSADYSRGEQIVEFPEPIDDKSFDTILKVMELLGPNPARLKMYLPYLERVVTPQCDLLRAESTKESVDMLHQIGEYTARGMMGGVGGVPLFYDNGPDDIERIMSNRRFLKVLEELGSMPKTQAASIVNEEINKTLPLYLSMFDERIDIHREIGDVREGGQMSNNADKSPVFHGLRCKILALVFTAGNLGLDETYPAVLNVARVAITQRKYWYYSDEFRRYDRGLILSKSGLYNRQILATGLFGTSGRQEKGMEDMLETIDIECQERKLTHFDSSASVHDFYAGIWGIPVDYSGGVQIVKFPEPIDDKSFDAILKAMEMEDLLNLKVDLVHL